MNDSPTADQVLRDVEFEILQSALGQDDLAQALQTARRFHLQSRHELLSTEARGRDRDLAARQFQIDDMLLVLLQEMASRLRQLQVELQRTAGLMPYAEAGGRPGAIEPVAGMDGPGLAGPPLDVASGSVEANGKVERLHVEANIRPVRLPLVGGLLTRLRAALHTLPVFYVRQLAEQQAEVNRALGESVARMNQLLAEQQAQIEALRRQVQNLQARSGPAQPPDAE